MMIVTYSFNIIYIYILLQCFIEIILYVQQLKNSWKNVAQRLFLKIYFNIFAKAHMIWDYIRFSCLIKSPKEILMHAYLF